MIEAILKHGAGSTGPFLDESVPVKETKAPRFFSSTGYGSKIPTAYMVKWQSRWRRVYAICYSNASSFYIKSNDGLLFVNIYN